MNDLYGRTGLGSGSFPGGWPPFRFPIGQDVVCIRTPEGIRCFPIFDPIGAGGHQWSGADPASTGAAPCPTCRESTDAATKARAKYSAQYCDYLQEELKLLQDELHNATPSQKPQLVRDIRNVLRELAVCGR
jgi:hypothetical protein